MNADGTPAPPPPPPRRELVPYAGGLLVACSADRIDSLSATFQKIAAPIMRTASLRFGSDENDAIAVALSPPPRRPRSPRR